MIDKDDWRMIHVTEQLKNKSWYHFSSFKKLSDIWDHEHCDLCMVKFSEYDCDLHIGYMDTKTNTHKTIFICEECFEDFKDMLYWESYKE